MVLSIERRADSAPRGADEKAPPRPARAEGRAVVWLLALIALILSAAALRATMLVTMPLAFAFFVAVVMYPVEQALAARLPARLQWLAVLATMLLIVSAVAVAVLAIWLALLPVTERAPGYVDRLQEQIDAWRAWAARTASPCRPISISPAR